MTIFSKRLAAKRDAEARARGENVDYLTREIQPEFRMKLWLALLDLTNVLDFIGGTMQTRAIGALHANLQREYGKGRFSTTKGQITPWQDLQSWIFREASAEQLRFSHQSD